VSGRFGWCLPLGLSIQGLRDEFDVEDLEGDWDAVREAVAEDDEPVIVTIANPSPLVELVGDHAVVIFRIESAEDDGEQVVYMDPSTGTYESKPLNEFLQWWDAPGQRGFLLRR
jgi:hypothetical protein